MYFFVIAIERMRGEFDILSDMVSVSFTTWPGRTPKTHATKTSYAINFFTRFWRKWSGKCSKHFSHWTIHFWFRSISFCSIIVVLISLNIYTTEEYSVSKRMNIGWVFAAVVVILRPISFHLLAKRIANESDCSECMRDHAAKHQTTLDSGLIQ